VTAATISDGLGWAATVSTTYSGAQWSVADWAFRGFGAVIATDPTGTRTLTAFYQDDFKKGQPASVSVEDPLARPFSRIEYSYSDIAPFPGVVWPRLDRTDFYQYDGGTTFRQTAISREYDTYGNPTRLYH
jgi:hypothetical protein